mmetsp:Transcript_57025/g.94770  ORF Transcript_57025/g.94770 Transcript_57025/m.94770 type:complete len:337 (-) Transcript_57025:53-1063(-)
MQEHPAVENHQGQPTQLVLGKVVDGEAAVVAEPLPLRDDVAAPSQLNGSPHGGEQVQESPLVFYGRLLFIVVLLSVCAWIFVTLLPRLMDFIVDVTSPISDDKDKLEVILIVALFFFYFGLVPSLGKRAWFLAMSHIYGWWALIFILTGHIIGSTIDFLFGKWLRARMDKDPAFCSCCWHFCTCNNIVGRSCDRCFACSQILNYIKVLKVPIQERPFRLVLLLMLMPSPTSITAGLLGGYVDGLSLLHFIVPWSIGGLKFARDVYIGTKVADLASYIRGDSKLDPVDTVVTVVSILLTLAVGVWFVKYAQRQVQQTYNEVKAREASQEMPRTPSSV